MKPRVIACQFLVCFPLLMASCVDAQALPSGASPRSKTLIVSHDQQALFTPAFVIAEVQKLDGDAIVQIIKRTVDAHAEAEVDMLVQCVFARFTTGMPRCKSAQTWRPTPDLFPRPQNNHLWNGLKKLAGRDRLQIVLDRCRRKKVKFIAGIRMNDRHRVTAFVQKMYDEHPEWRLRGIVGALADRKGGLDFKYDGVREKLLDFIAEFLVRYDADGIELDYMRMCHMFRPDEAKANAELLNEMMEKVRRLLTRAADRRRRDRLILGVRVPATIVECTNLGLDVRHWIGEGLVDYVTPSDFWATDYETRTHAFVELTKDTNCRILPSISPVAAYPGDGRYLTPAEYRGAARNFYAFGADGVAAYNYFWTWAYQYNGVTAGVKNPWPTQSLSRLTQLKKPRLLNGLERRYLRYPLWTDLYPTGARRLDRLVVRRSKPRGESHFYFSMAERLSQSQDQAVLSFLASGVAPGDSLAFTLQAKPLPADRITRTRVSSHNSNKSRKAVGPTYRYRIVLPNKMTTFGANRFGARLKTSSGNGKLVIENLQVVVTPAVGSALNNPRR